MERYQNFPCWIDSIGSMPSGAPTDTALSPPGASARTVVPAAAVTGGRPPIAGEPRVGMTAEEVAAIRG
jgi:hypothetical protein